MPVIPDPEDDFEGCIAALVKMAEAEVAEIPEDKRAAYWLMRAAERVAKAMDRRLNDEFWPEFVIEDNLDSLDRNIRSFRNGFKPEIRGFAFRDGAAAFRTMIADFVEQGGHPEIAQSIRLNWNPQWGSDPKDDQ